MRSWAADHSARVSSSKSTIPKLYTCSANNDFFEPTCHSSFRRLLPLATMCFMNSGLRAFAKPLGLQKPRSDRRYAIFPSPNCRRLVYGAMLCPLRSDAYHCRQRVAGPPGWVSDLKPLRWLSSHFASSICEGGAYNGSVYGGAVARRRSETTCPLGPGLHRLR